MLAFCLHKKIFHSENADQCRDHCTHILIKEIKLLLLFVVVLNRLNFVSQNCRDNTVGDYCSACAPGYYGKVTGSANDCSPCACPRANPVR